MDQELRVGPQVAAPSRARDEESRVGKTTLAAVGGGDGKGLFRGGGLLVEENWQEVQVCIAAVWGAKDASHGAGLAWTMGSLHGRAFQDGNRPAQWLYKLLLAYNRVVSGEEGAWPELRACTSYMPAHEQARVWQEAVPRKKPVPKKGPPPKITPGVKHIPGAKPQGAIGADVGATTPDAARHDVDVALQFESVLRPDGYREKKPLVDAYKTTWALAAVRKAHLPFAPAQHLFDTWKQLGGAVHTNEQHAVMLDGFRHAVQECVHGHVMTAATAARLLGWAGSFEYKARTPQQIEADKQGAANETITQAQVILYKLRELRESLQKRGGWTVRPAFTTRYAHDYATWLAGEKPNTVLEALERAVDAHDAAAVQKVLQREPWQWLVKDDRFLGDPLKLAAYLEEQNKAGIEQGKLISDIVGVTPVGPFAKLIVTVPVELLAYQTGQQSGWTTVFNIGVKALAGPLDRYLGKMTPLRHAIIDGFRGAFENLAGNMIKVFTSDRPWNEKLELASELWKSAVLAGFTTAIASTFKHVTENMDESQRKVWLDALIDAATDVGLKKPVEEELKKFVPDPPKRGSW